MRLQPFGEMAILSSLLILAGAGWNLACLAYNSLWPWLKKLWCRLQPSSQTLCGRNCPMGCWAASLWKLCLCDRLLSEVPQQPRINKTSWAAARSRTVKVHACIFIAGPFRHLRTGFCHSDRQAKAITNTSLCHRWVLNFIYIYEES